MIGVEAETRPEDISSCFWDGGIRTSPGKVSLKALFRPIWNSNQDFLVCIQYGVPDYLTGVVELSSG